MSVYPVMRDPETRLRLLSFQSSPSSLTLKCGLEVYDTTDCPPYHAITYAYGDRACSHWLVLNGEEISMNQNGYNALQQVRAPVPGAPFWLDFLCINQTDLEEKAIQVHKIAKIFAGSFEVWAYLGPHGDDRSSYCRDSRASLKKTPPEPEFPPSTNSKKSC